MRGKPFILFILLVTGLSECTTSVSEIGADFFTNKNTFDISYIDTVSLAVSTVRRDSLVTSDTKHLLVGYHEDEKLGNLTTQGIFQVGITSPVTLDKSTTEYVGLRLSLKKDGYWLYDTTKTQTLSVYRLTRDLVAYTGFYYNTSQFTVDSSAPPLGSLAFLPRPRHTLDSLEVPLSDDLGKQLMEMAHTSDPRLSTNATFLKFFKGIALVPDTANSRAIVGFQSSGSSKPLELRLYYNDRSTTPTSLKHVSFTIGSNHYFTSIHADRSATKLKSLEKANQAISSTLTDHEGYFQCGVGLGMRVEIPHLTDLRNSDPAFIATRAILEFRPVKSSYNTKPLPSTLVMYYVDQQNNLLTSTPFGIQLVKDVENGLNTLYQGDVTTFVNTQLQNIVETKNALLILDDAQGQYRTTVDRLYIGDQRNQYNMRLRLFYLTLPNQTN